MTSLTESNANDYLVWSDMVQDYDPDLTWERIKNAWNTILFNPDIYGYLIRVDNQIVGFAHLVYHTFPFAVGTTCYLSDLYVKREFRRKGIATEVLNQFIQIAKDSKWERLYWVTEHGNPARTLYDSVAKCEFVRYHTDF
jgi:GNAT superfamily N-acetyltransferase